MIQPLVVGERGCAGLVSFDQRVEWLQECANEPGVLERAFERLQPLLRPGEDKEARLLAAVQSAVERLRQRPGVRRVLLLVSESRDRGSETALDAVTIAAQTAGVTVYAATYSAFKTAFTSKAPVGQPRRPVDLKEPIDPMGSVNGELARLAKTNTTEALAKSTGGALFPFTRQKALEEAIAKLGAELHSQYVLSFVPEVSTPGYHRLEVQLTRPGPFHIRARPGYWQAEDAR